MRRSVREALVGFSLLAGLAGGTGLWLWLKGVSISRSTWSFSASFSDAAGLAARSPVVYRGVLVGNVRSIRVTSQAVVAELEITNPDLVLPRPVVAQVGTASLLGGDARVSLVSAGAPPSQGTPGPRSAACNDRRLVCSNGHVQGTSTASIDSVTTSVQRLLDQADRDQLVAKLVAATTTFSQTAKEADKLSREGQQFLAEAKLLVHNLNGSAIKLDPILTQATAASVDFAQASRHIRNITAALDNPRTAADLQATLSNAKQLTDRWSAVGSDVRRLTDDPQFIEGIRSVSVGLGRFFQELYPAAAVGPSGGQPTDVRQRPRASAAAPLSP
jgi:phospholipid/cholesterol/gamma-HCH transport system substrate-binding protein